VAPIKNEGKYGRNDMVTIKKGDEMQTVKFKKADRFLPRVGRSWDRREERVLDFCKIDGILRSGRHSVGEGEILCRRKCSIV